MNRRRIDSASAVPGRSAVAYLTSWSYCWAISSHRIGLVSTRPSWAWAAASSGRYSRIAPMFFNRGNSLKPSSSVKANPTTDAPCVST